MDLKVENYAQLFNPPEAGCVLFMPGLPGGSNRLHDRSAYGNQGTITGPVWTRQASGLWCLAFDGVDDYVQCADAPGLDITQDITITGWVKRNSINRREVLAVKRYVGVNDCNYEFEITNDAGYANRLYFSYQDTAGSWEPNVYSQGTIDVNWHQVAVTRSALKIRFFIDGKLDANEYVPSKNMNAVNLYPLTIGALSGIAYLSGCLALLRVYKRALTALEIQNKFNEEKSLFGVW